MFGWFKKNGKRTRAMTPEEFADQMQEICDSVGRDRRAAHYRMDKLMANMLVKLGYQDGIAIFDKQKKYYA